MALGLTLVLSLLSRRDPRVGSGGAPSNQHYDFGLVIETYNNSAYPDLDKFWPHMYAGYNLTPPLCNGSSAAAQKPDMAINVNRWDESCFIAVLIPSLGRREVFDTMKSLFTSVGQTASGRCNLSFVVAYDVHDADNLFNELQHRGRHPGSRG